MPIELAPMEKPTTTKAPAPGLSWILLWAAICSVALLGIMAAKWPFTRQAMIHRLEHATSARVEMRGFRSTYFPYPGCIAEEVVFRPKTPAAGNKPPEPIITIQKLTIESPFAGLFSRPARIMRIVADGLRVRVPPGGASLHTEAGSQRDQTVIEELRADNALLELASSHTG